MLKIVENLWAVGAPPRTPLGQLTALPQTPSWRGLGWCPLPKNPTSALRLRLFGLRSCPFRMNNPGHALASLHYTDDDDMNAWCKYARVIIVSVISSAKEVMFSSALVSQFVCLLAGLRPNYSISFHKIRWKVPRKNRYFLTIIRITLL